MSPQTPNDQQQTLIDSTDGLYVVDAGAGTGKTFTVTRRYAAIVDQDGVDPDDVLLVTFTNNAAAEMTERIVSQSSYGTRELADAPIQTFHSLCYDLLEEYGHAAPTLLGIDERITGSTRIIEDDLVLESLFGEFIDRFSDTHPEYDDLFRAISDPVSLQGLISQLTSKGVFPTADGWYRDGEQHLDGDFDAFKQLFDELNAPRNGGSRQSRLKGKLNGYGKGKTYLPDAPKRSELRGSDKQLPASVARLVFDEDRDHLKGFVHDVYHAYLEFALRRNYLTFGMLQLFAFTLLCEDHALRDELAFEYTMVDEFQDTSELQFKLALLLSGTENLCVVGDWKQSIYAFQYAEVDNILEFESRLQRFIHELNADHPRIPFDGDGVETIELVENYRSTQRILDFSEEALVVPAAKRDDVDAEVVRERIVSLESNAAFENTRIEALSSEDEYEAILERIETMVGNDDYAVEEDGEQRPPEFGDIAVLTRTRDFGRELLAVAEEYGYPMAYEGGLELFRTDEAKLLLAWLRILEADTDRGWALVLEAAGYSLHEVRAMVDAESYPVSMTDFREELRDADTLGGVARAVFARYGEEGPTADVILTTLQSVHDASTMTRGDLIRILERGIETGSTHEVHGGAGTDAVTVQTIHAAKGLEYPIVILANMNAGRFPPSGGGSRTITYEDPVGLRQRKLFDAEASAYPHVYDNWRADVVRRCLPRDYDEERRLLYVGITRAESHVVFTAGEDPNQFLQELPVDVTPVDPDIEPYDDGDDGASPFEVTIADPTGPRSLTPHDLMDDSLFEDVEEGEGTAFGTQVHEFAEAYALGADVEPSNDDERNVVAFLDSLSGELQTEVEARLPLTVDGDQVIISGVVDLVHVTPHGVDIVDFKTDRGDHAQAEYRKQLSVYAHVVAAAYPDRDVTASILYTETGVAVEIDVLERSDLRRLARELVSVA